MAKVKRVFVCNGCGHRTAKWLGRCPDCREWNTLIEEIEGPAASGRAPVTLSERPVSLAEIPVHGGGEIRLRTGLSELDTPLGGGLVAGSLVLLGGDPGVGKSTLLLMACERFAQRGLPVLYVTGEESLQQVRLRADRLGVSGPSLLLLATTDLAQVEAACQQVGPVVLIIDSVQTIHSTELRSIPGSVAQVREVAHRCMQLAKTGPGGGSEGVRPAVLLVGHVTKSGEIAGPKVLEHLVDTVLYFEGDGRSSLRVLRSVKNRFGATGELGLFEMAGDGLREVPDASARLLSERCADAPGTAVVAGMEGNRPLLVEVQALVGRPSPGQFPARTCVGVDRGRVTMLAAVMEKAGQPLHDRDLYVNAAGGLRLVEPAADLALVAAIASSLRDQALPEDTLCFGEVGLVGEVRAVSHPVPRLKEAARHGFRRALVPPSVVTDAPPQLEVIGVRNVSHALQILLGDR